MLIRQIRRQEVQLLETIESIREEEYNRLGFSEDDVDAQLVIYRDVLQRWEQSPLFFEERRRSPTVHIPLTVVHLDQPSNLPRSPAEPATASQPSVTNGYTSLNDQLATIHETQSIASHSYASAEELPLLISPNASRRNSVMSASTVNSTQTTTTTLVGSMATITEPLHDIMSEEYEEKVAEWRRCLQDIIDNDKTYFGVDEGVYMPSLILELNTPCEKFATIHLERNDPSQPPKPVEPVPITPEETILQTVRRLRSLSTCSYAGIGKGVSYRSLMSLNKRDTSMSQAVSRMDLGTVADLTIDRERGDRDSSMRAPSPPSTPEINDGQVWRPITEIREETYAELIWQITEEGSDVGQVRCPADVGFLSDGKLIIADTENLRLQIYDQRGRWHANIGAGKIKPRRIAVMPDGQLIITDALGACVKIINLVKEKITTFGKGKALKNTLKSPCAVAITRLGEFVVSDSSNGTVVICRPDGKNTQQFATTFKNPTSIFVDEKGRILVADNWEHCVKVFDSSGQFLFEIAELDGPGSQRLQYPSSVCCDKNGNIYVSEWGKHTVCQFNEDGQFLRYILTRDNEIRHPTGVAVHNGRLVVCEYSDEHSALRLFKLINI